MSIYIFITIILVLSFLLYIKIAKHYRIVDKPNERSSHNVITIRGGGVIFTIAVLLWFLFYGFNHPWIILATLIIALVSFLDDIFTLSNRTRFLIHILTVSILFYQFQIFESPWYVIGLAYVFTIGYINAFNFMDGINGITALYTLTTLVSIFWLNLQNEIVSQHLLIVLIISILIFSFFNVRNNAKVFAGDVGSVTLAFLLAWFMISLINESNQVMYILFFAVYGIDTAFTILHRLIQHENIFIAHRSHLYQYLSNELKCSHIFVSVLYSITQVIINILTITLIAKGIMSWTIFFIILIILIFGYLFLRYWVIKKIQKC